MRPAKPLMLVAIFVLAMQPAMAVITFEQLNENTFTISHRIKIFGGRGKAMKTVYEKAASLCVAAGYAYFTIEDQESDAGGQYESANASARVRLFFEDGEDRIDCLQKSSQEYIDQATLKLEKRGYQHPELVAGVAADDLEAVDDTGPCTIDQITKMVEAGLTKDQIKAACGVE